MTDGRAFPIATPETAPEAVLRRLMDVAMRGDSAALRALTERLYPQPAGRLITVEDANPVVDITSALDAVSEVLNSMLAGKISGAEAQQLTRPLLDYARALEQARLPEEQTFTITISDAPPALCAPRSDDNNINNISDAVHLDKPAAVPIVDVITAIELADDELLPDDIAVPITAPARSIYDVPWARIPRRRW